MAQLGEQGVEEPHGKMPQKRSPVHEPHSPFLSPPLPPSTPLPYPCTQLGLRHPMCRLLRDLQLLGSQRHLGGILQCREQSRASCKEPVGDTAFMFFLSLPPVLWPMEQSPKDRLHRASHFKTRCIEICVAHSGFAFTFKSK